MKRDQNDPAYVNEVWRRWQRRRDLPFRQLDTVLGTLRTAIRESALVRPLDQFARRLSRLLSR